MNKKQKPTENLEVIAENIRLYLYSKDAARENALRLCREITRFSARAIRAVHRQEETEAEQFLASARTLLEELNSSAIDSHDELLYTGFVHDAQKEFVEANITIALIRMRPLPAPQALGVSCSAFLNGLGEAVGELRRHILDNLRRDDFSRCEEVLFMMDDICDTLVTMDFPDAITHNLRRTTDSVRGIVEKTRGDLTIALKQRGLEEKLK